MFRIIKLGTTEKLIIAITTSRFSSGAGYTASSITATFYKVNDAGAALEIDTAIGTNGVVTLSADTGSKTGFHTALLDVSALTAKIYVVVFEATVDSVAAIGHEVLDIDAERKKVADYVDASINSRSSHTAANVVTAMQDAGTKLTALHAKLPSKSYLAGTGNSDGDVQMDEATGNFPGTVGKSAVTLASTDVTGHLPAEVKAEDNIDFGALKKASLNAATPASIVGAVGSVAAGVTVTTNNDKTGYALTVTPPTTSDIKTAIEAEGSILDTISDKLGAFTGTGVNTMLGFFRALMRKDVGVTTPSDVGGTFTHTTDSNEAIKDAIDDGAVTLPVMQGTVYTATALQSREVRIKRGDKPYRLYFDLDDDYSAWTPYFAMKRRMSDSTYIIAPAAATWTTSTSGEGYYDIADTSTYELGNHYAEIELRAGDSRLTAIDFKINFLQKVIE